MGLSLKGIQSKFIIIWIECTIIWGAWQVRERMKSKPHFSYNLSITTPCRNYCQKNTLISLSSHFFFKLFKYSSGDSSCCCPPKPIAIPGIAPCPCP